MNPCRKCVVRACCSQDCEDFKKFSDKWSVIASFISIVISGFLTVLVLYLISNLENPFKNFLYFFIWLSTLVYNLFFIVKCKMDNAISDLVCIVFAPFIFGIFTQIHLYSVVFRKSVRKRV